MWIALILSKAAHEVSLEVLLGEVESTLVWSCANRSLQAVEGHDHLTDHSTEHVDAPLSRRSRRFGRSLRHVCLVRWVLDVAPYITNGNAWLPFVQRSWGNDVVQEDLLNLVDSELLAKIGSPCPSFLCLPLNPLCLLDGLQPELLSTVLLSLDCPSVVILLCGGDRVVHLVDLDLSAPLNLLLIGLHLFVEWRHKVDLHSVVPARSEYPKI